MSDKKQALVQIFSIDISEQVVPFLPHGHCYHLVFRNDPLEVCVFDSISGLSQIASESALHQELSKKDLSQLERKFYNPSHKSFHEIFHKPLQSASIFTSHEPSLKHAQKYGISPGLSDACIQFNVDMPFVPPTEYKAHFICFPVDAPHP
jgi:hypothetical protein